MTSRIAFFKPTMSILGKTFGYATVSMTGYMAYMLPNTFFIEKTQNFAQLYKNGEPISVPPNIQKLSEDVLEDLKWAEEQKRKLKLFIHSGFNFFYAGSVWENKFIGKFEEAIVGIPGHYILDSSIKMQKDILVKGEPVDWTSESGKELYQSLLLSDNAKKFALAENFFYTSKCEPLMKGVFTSVLILLTLLFVKNPTTVESIKRRLSRYSLLFVLFNSVLWIGMMDVYNCSLQKKADKQLASLGRSYVEGGVEYYEALIKRNMTLNAISEERGGKPMFTAFGNEKSLIRQRHLPLTERKDFFKKLVN